MDPRKGAVMKKTGIAVIGLGPASQPHAQSLVDLADRVEVRWAVSRSAEKTRAFAERYPFPVTTDMDAAIADPAVEAVIVLTPPNAHLAVAEACFRAGKHVLVEKPLEVSLASAERLVALSRGSGRRFGVVLQHRFRPGAQRLRRLIGQGALGRIEAGSVSVPWWRPQSYYDEPGRGTLARDGGGVLITQAIHVVDLFRSLVGVRAVEAAQVTTTALHRMETEDYVAALLRLGEGGPGTLMATTAMCPGLPERIEILATRGSASLVGGALHVAYLDGREERVEAEGRTGCGANIMDFPNDAHRALIADFLDAIAEGRDPLVSGEEALATHRLIEEVLAVGRAATPAPAAARAEAG
jgi:predicted dehydrogenase